MKIVLRALLALLMAMCLLTFSVGVYFYFDEPFLSYKGLPFAASGKAKPGEPVLLQVTRCNKDHKTRLYLISHALISLREGHRTVLPASQVSIEPGCTTETSAANVIPPQTLPGMYLVEGYAEISGTFKSFSVHWYSQPFEVI